MCPLLDILSIGPAGLIEMSKLCFLFVCYSEKMWRGITEENEDWTFCKYCNFEFGNYKVCLI